MLDVGASRGGTVARARRPVVWTACATAWWLAHGWLSAHQYMATTARWGLRSEWSHVLLAELGSAITWIPLTVLALWLAHRFPLGRPTVRGVAAHTGALALAVLGRVQVAVVLAEWLGCYPALPPAGELLATTGQQHAFTYLLVTGVSHAVHYASAHRRRETDLVRAELAVLRAQMRPHFLLNALHTVAALVREDPDRAERTVVALGALLRRSLESAEDHLVPLHVELDLVRAYLDVEQARHGDRLRVTWDVDPRATHAPVPPLTLQPLAENAVRHDLGPVPGGGHVTVVVRVEDGGAAGRVRMAVVDDGVGPPDPEHVVEGIGLGSTRVRLRRAYGGDHELVLAAHPGGGAVATVVVPSTGPRTWGTLPPGSPVVAT